MQLPMTDGMSHRRLYHGKSILEDNVLQEVLP